MSTEHLRDLATAVTDLEVGDDGAAQLLVQRDARHRAILPQHAAQAASTAQEGQSACGPRSSSWWSPLAWATSARVAATAGRTVTFSGSWGVLSVLMSW